DWLDKPDPQSVDRAEQLLITLGALQSVEGRESSGGEPHGVANPSTLDSRSADLSSPLGPRPSPLSPRPSDLTAIGRQMLRLPMHPRYSRMLVEAARFNCVPAAALCAALVSGRDLLMRLGRDDQHIKEARELFEASQDA